MDLKDKGIASRHTEGNKCTCIDANEHQLLVASVNASFIQDYNRNSERRKSAPTSETMRAKALSYRNGNGHR